MPAATVSHTQHIRADTYKSLTYKAIYLLTNGKASRAGQHATGGMGSNLRRNMRNQPHRVATPHSRHVNIVHCINMHGVAPGPLLI